LRSKTLQQKYLVGKLIITRNLLTLYESLSDGGGFMLGANSWPQYDHAKVVKLANEHGVPVIGVGIKSVI
jgi:hypothetical protein